jgi:hypothetical protein
MPTYNGEQHLRQALESLLLQTHPDFAIVMVDDGSTDASPDIAAEYAQLDARLRFERSDGSRLGMTRNWARAYRRARELHPQARYFAWVSDHDVWHPRWLAALVAALEADARAVLAYPLNVGISDENVVIREPWTFHTDGVDDARERLIRSARGMVAGNMVYGLFRADLPGRFGDFRSVLLPDRLLLAECALLGTFVQVPEILWLRRYSAGKAASRARQRQSFFPDGAPFWSHAPWPWQHTLPFAVDVAVRGTARPLIGRAAGRSLAATYLWHSSRFEVRRALGRRRQQLRRRALQREQELLRRLQHDRAVVAEPVRFVLRNAHRTSHTARELSASRRLTPYRVPDYLKPRRQTRAGG